MATDAWNSLLHLESRDFIENWFFTIHQRKLNARRSREIIASARQGREYFRCAAGASFAVRPLLAFYGVASLCRAISLLNSRNSGEEGLTQGHGLETVAWSGTLSGDLPSALTALTTLRVRSCGGLFADMQAATRRKIVLRAYDDSIQFNGEELSLSDGKYEVSFSDILTRIPDIFLDHTPKAGPNGVQISSINHSSERGLVCTVFGTADHPVCAEFSALGCEVAKVDDPYDTGDGKSAISITPNLLPHHFPMILEARVYRTRGGYPAPYLVKRIPQVQWLSQLSLTYALSFILGMLARYFPTHWTGLMSGEKGDAAWPIINSAQSYVEKVVPDLIVLAIEDALYEKQSSRDD